MLKLAISAMLLFGNYAQANSKHIDIEQIDQTFQIEELLTQLDDIITSTSYSEHLYYIPTEEGIYRFLFVHNPELKSIECGFVTIKHRYIFGFDNDCPNQLYNSVVAYRDTRQLSGIISAGSWNGKSIIEVFGYK